MWRGSRVLTVTAALVVMLQSAALAAEVRLNAGHVEKQLVASALKASDERKKNKTKNNGPCLGVRLVWERAPSSVDYPSCVVRAPCRLPPQANLTEYGYPCRQHRLRG